MTDDGELDVTCSSSLHTNVETAVFSGIKTEER